jgi:hypothetical protein
MAKSDAFYIRATVTGNATYAQAEIDLGSFVNLGVKNSTLLRIHSVQCAVRDANNHEDPVSAASAYGIGWQLTTESQSDLVYMSDKSVVASGQCTGYNGQIAEDGSASADFATAFITDAYDLNPSEFKKGYLIGVDTLFLGTESSVTLATGDYRVDLIIECSLENATQSTATSLALSQM